MKKVLSTVRWAVPVISCVALFAAATAHAYTWTEYNTVDSEYWAKNDECNQDNYDYQQAIYDPDTWGDPQQYADAYSECQDELSALYEEREEIWLSIETNGES